MIYKNLTQWQLGANYPYVPVLSRAAETGQILNSVFDPIPATVPGCVHNDLLQAGIIDDPYFEMNALSAAFVENFWWTYQTQFTVEPHLKGRHLRLRLAGVDYHANISLNQTPLGEQVGMYVPFCADITNLVSYDHPNALTVLLRDPPKEMGQIGYTSLTHIQKARFTYKWDFSTRLVQVGLYDTVTVEDFGIGAIEYTKVTTNLTKNRSEVTVQSDLTMFEAGQATLQYTLTHQGEVVATHRQSADLLSGEQSVTATFGVENPKLWYPNGKGEQPVYELTMQLIDHDGLSDQKTYQVGFRTLTYLQADGAPAHCLPYSVAVNGVRTYIKGVNMVPFDIMYGRVQPQTVDRFLRLAKEAGINLIRVWGGGLIESEYFYDQCDRYGLMVWQEFIQSSSGIDNVPSKDPAFLAQLKRTATHAVRTKQHHPCLTFWCGGNELEDEHRVPSTFDDPNIAMLKEVVDRFDGETLMLPTSATGLFEFLNVDRPGENYDVHGPWKYEGTQRHYMLYNRSDSQLHSEFGVDGMNNRTSLETFLSAPHLKVQSMDNPVWRFHGEMWETYHRDRAVFPPLPEDRLDDFILSSQFMQAEGLKYAVEANRRRAFQNVGSIIWQFNEPWPNVSGTNLVDYYGVPKLAYYSVKAAFRDAYPSMRYDKLVYQKGEAAQLQLFMMSEHVPKEWTVTTEIVTAEGEVLLQNQHTVTAGDGKSANFADCSVVVPDTNGFVVTLTADNGSEQVVNRYLLLTENEQGLAHRETVLQLAPDLYR